MFSFRISISHYTQMVILSFVLNLIKNVLLSVAKPAIGLSKRFKKKKNVTLPTSHLYLTFLRRPLDVETLLVVDQLRMVTWRKLQNGALMKAQHMKLFVLAKLLGIYFLFLLFPFSFSSSPPSQPYYLIERRNHVCAFLRP